MDAAHPHHADAPDPPPDTNVGGPRTNKPSFEGLDVLRLVACLSVVVYHYTFRGSTHDHFTSFAVPEVQFVTKYGYFGVELFFVISGFVITYSTCGRKPMEFLVSRIARIYPGFLCCMSVTFAIMLLFGHPVFDVTWLQWLANLLIAAPIVGKPFVDGAYWSIVCELIFYAWVFCLKSASLFDRHVVKIVAVWASLSVLDLLVLHAPAVSALLLTKYSGFFCAGMLIYEWLVRRNRAALPLFLGMVLPLALLQSLDGIAYHSAYYAGTSFSPLIGAAACIVLIGIVALAVAAPQVGARRGIILLAGGATYPMYLLHQNIGYVILNRFTDSVPAGYLLAGTVCALLALATTVWHFAEKPGQTFVRTRLGPLLSPATLRLR